MSARAGGRSRTCQSAGRANRRGAYGGAAGLVFAGTQFLGFSVQQFAIATALIAVGWLGLAYSIGRRFRELAPADPADPD